MTVRLQLAPPAELVDALAPIEGAAGPSGAVAAGRGGGTAGSREALAGGDGTSWLRLRAGAAVTLTPVDVVPDVRQALVGWLAGRRGPWRPRAVRLDGRALGHRREAARVRAGLVTIAPPALAPEVSVVDHLAAVVPRRRAERLLEGIPKLAGRGQDPAGVLSGGERQMVAWARASLAVPRVVVLDRAATGLDPEALAWATDVLRAWREAGCVTLVCAGRVEEAGWPQVTGPNGRAPGPQG